MLDQIVGGAELEKEAAEVESDCEGIVLSLRITGRCYATSRNEIRCIYSGEPHNSVCRGLVRCGEPPPPMPRRSYITTMGYLLGFM